MTDRPMRPCIPGRIVRLALRNRNTRKVTEHTVVYPWQWTKSSVLASVRLNHPESHVRIVEWADYSADRSFEPRVWIVNPQKIIAYSTTGKWRMETTSNK